MLIIVEGPDGAGKTTFVGELQTVIEGMDDIVEWPILLHRGPPEPGLDVLADLTKDEPFVADYEPGCGQHVICDRWHWGELVYGPYYRGASQLAGWPFAAVEAYLGVRGAIIVYLTAPVDVLVERVGGRGDDYIETRDLAYLVGQYELVSTISRLPHLVNPTITEAIYTAAAFEASAARRYMVTAPA